MDAQSLISEALCARSKSWSPYSHYAVGAALLTEDGSVITGANVECASYGMTLCAERVALVKAVSEGHRDFRAIAVVTQDGASCCGACRQFLREFARELPIYLGDTKGNLRETSLSALLPDSFGPENLGIE